MKHDILVKTHVVNVVGNDATMIPASVTRRAIYIVRHPFDVAVSLPSTMALAWTKRFKRWVIPLAIGSDNQVRQPLHTWSKHDSWCEEPRSVSLMHDTVCRIVRHILCEFGTVYGFKLDFRRLQRALDMTTFSNQKVEENGLKERLMVVTARWVSV